MILAELLEAPADGRGALARLAARTRRAGSGTAERVVADPALAGALPLDGIVREGLYLLLGAHQPLGFATGFVRGGNATPIAFSRVTADGLGTGDLSAATGRYSIPVTAGTDRHLVARHPALDEQGEGTIPSLAPAEVASLDLTIVPVPPHVLSVSPVEGATDQPLASAVSVLFSEPLDAATVTSSTLSVELAGPDGESTGVFIDGTVSLGDPSTVLFTPSRPLLPGRTFRALFAGSVADAGGTLYAGGPKLWTFSTSTTLVPGGQVHPEKFHVEIPVNGVARIYGEAAKNGEPGALPGAVIGQTPWAVSAEIEGPLDPVRDTFQGQADGSFIGTVGHVPGFPAELGSRIWVKVFDPTGALAAEFRLGPFEGSDHKSFVAPAGEAVTFRSAEGVVVDVPAGAFDQPTEVRVENLAPSAVGVPTPQGMALAAYVHLDFAGEAKETLRLSVPAPADAADGAQVFVGAPHPYPWGTSLRFLTVGGVTTRDGVHVMSNAPELQPEPAAGAFSSETVSRQVTPLVPKATGGSRSCKQAIEEGLPQCFLQNLLIEFRQASDSVWYYEQGQEWTLLTGIFPGLAGPWGLMSSILASGPFVYDPGLADTGGRFVLPVIVGESFELVERDSATGWSSIAVRSTPSPRTPDSWRHRSDRTTS